MGQLREALQRHERAVAEARRSAEELRARRELREMRRARLASLRELVERHEDAGDAVRFLSGLPEDDRRALSLRGLVREAFEAEPAVERAIEAERAEGVVVGAAAGALSALAALRRASAGRGVLVLDRGPSDEPLGFVPLGEPLLARVRPRPGYESVAQALLGRVNLVGQLGEALDHYGRGRIPCTFVTASGDVLTPDGVVRGGGEPGQSGLLTRVREVRELEGEVRTLEDEVSVLETVARRAEADLERASDELENLRNRHHTAALAVASHEKDLDRSRERVKTLGEAQEARGAERSHLLSEQEGMEGERARLQALLVAARDERIARQQALDALGLRIGAAGRERSRLEAVATERRVQQAGRGEACERVRSSLARLRAALAETREWVRRREAEISTAEERREELARTVADAEQQLAARLREEETARLGSEERRDAWEALAATVRELEAASRTVRVELEASRDEARQAELALREHELRREHLEASVRERWAVDLATWKPPLPTLDPLEAGAEPVEIAAFDVEDEAPPAEDAGAEAPAEGAEARDARREAREVAGLLALDADARRSRLEEVRQRLESLGDVNLGAIEEHEELRERFRFLDEQRNDLESSLEQLREAIARINRTSRKRFRETFDAVNERFQQNFPRLFRGGKAWLTLTETEDVLEAGIEITAQPPGKRLQSVNLLSGGEKTMTAIALLVSVFQVRPSPFFLLDEVDAALDDANVGRFNEIVKEMSRESQFLLITHNKRTIEVAERLYGVTMEERGVSKLVAVELHAAQPSGPSGRGRYARAPMLDWTLLVVASLAGATPLVAFFWLLRRTRPAALALPPAAAAEPLPAPARAPEAPARVEPPPRATLGERLARTKEALVGRLGGVLGVRRLDASLLGELEALLFGADLGVRTAEDLLGRVRREAEGGDAARVRAVLRAAIAEKLVKVEPAGDPLALAAKPHVVLVLGVNGSGKTTTIGKLAARHRKAGRSVILGAGDTFRAAAREQLQRWGERTGCEVIVGADGGDPAAVAFDTVKAARARGVDVAIIDTAGRLQTKVPLLEELAKIVRVVGKDLPGAPHETLLVLDANTGQNAIAQAREFTSRAGVSALVLTKLDGTAKGGVIVGLADELGLPVKYVGLGEGVEDLRDFSAAEFVEALFDG